MNATPEQLASRVRALGRAVDAAEGRSDAETVARAATVVQRAGQRVALSGGYTVVAFAGATGSGKSSLFNAVSGTELAHVAVRRPTTSKTMAVSWGQALPHELLDWLDVTKRHLVPSPEAEFSDLVLLDLPDHDSTEVTHRLAVDRLVELVDALVWVVDPQKYADAALHDGYLKRLAPYADVMMVVLNQADRLAPSELDRCLNDLRRLLDSEGLKSTPIMATSALHGTGIPELRAALARTVATKQAMTRRLAADVTVAASALEAELGSAAAPTLDARTSRQLTSVLGEAAGVPAGGGFRAQGVARAGCVGHRLAVRHLGGTPASRPAEEVAAGPRPVRPQPDGRQPHLAAQGDLGPAGSGRTGITRTGRGCHGRAATRLGPEGAADRPRE